MTEPNALNVICVRCIPVFVAAVENAKKFWIEKLSFERVNEYYPPTQSKRQNFHEASWQNC